MNDQSMTTIESDSMHMKRVQRISMQYESKNLTPRSQVTQRKLPSSPRPPTSPHSCEPKKVDLSSEDGVSRKRSKIFSKNRLIYFFFHNFSDFNE